MKVKITKPRPALPTVEFILTAEEATFVRDVLGKFSDPALKKHLEEGWPQVKLTSRQLALFNSIYDTIDDTLPVSE